MKPEEKLGDIMKYPGVLNYDEMKKLSVFTESENIFIGKNIKKLHRTGATAHYISLSENNEKDPLRMQFVPSEKELSVYDYEKRDPLCEKDFAVSGRIIHRYPDRVLFIATSRCALYCRHCFRRYLDREGKSDAGCGDADMLSSYIKSDKKIREVLITGGDPLMLDNSFLEYILAKIREARKDIVIRVGTRMPVVYPQRIDRELAELLSRFRPLYIFTQFNHVREVSGLSAEALDILVRSGIPVFNQTVLLRGINNSAEDLSALFYRLIQLSVKPYYLFQGDLAAGTSHFRTNLMEGIEIMEELRKKMSALSLPLLAVDLPGGGGKALLDRGSVVKRENSNFYIKSNEGKIIAYPDEK